MRFSKAIQIKQLVTDWNKDRWDFGYGYVKFECSMFSLGNWSVILKPVDTCLFFSQELEQFLKLYSKGGFTMFIGSMGSAPYISIQ